jgi:ABC-type amino acid transport substrate-binding protein
MRRHRNIALFILALFLLAGCGADEADPVVTHAAPTPPAVQEEPTPQAATPVAENFKTIAVDAPFPPFSDFDDFGNVVGFDAELAQNLASRLGFDFEFVVTSYTGMVESVGSGEFDLAVSAITNPLPAEGVVYSDPYLETGQVMVVLANERELVSHTNMPPGIAVGVVADSLAGWQAATRIAGIPATDLDEYPTPGTALQALIDGLVTAVILDLDESSWTMTTPSTSRARITSS